MHHPRAWLAAALVAGVGFPASLWAQEPAQGNALLIRAEHLIVKPGVVLENAQVSVKDGRIVAVGVDLQPLPGAQEVRGKWVSAGLIDAWSTLGVDPESVADGNVTPATRSADAVDPWLQAHLRREALRAGVVAVRAQAGLAARVGGVGAVVRLAEGLDDAQRFVARDAVMWATVGLGAGAPGGFQIVDGEFVQMPGQRGMDVFERIDMVDRLLAQVVAGRGYLVAMNEHKHELADWKKKVSEKEAELEKDAKKAKKDRDKAESDAKEKGKPFEEKKYKEDFKKPADPRFDEDSEAWSLVADGAIPLLVHVNRDAELRALLAGLEGVGRLRLVVAGGAESARHAKHLAKQGVAVLVNALPMGSGRSDEYDAHDLSLAARLGKDGVKVAIGSGGMSPDATRDLALLAAQLVGHGLPRVDAMAGVTTNAAEVLGVERAMGTVEVGKHADLVVWNAEPLSTAASAEYVVSAGRVVLAPEQQ